MYCTSCGVRFEMSTEEITEDLAEEREGEQLVNIEEQLRVVLFMLVCVFVLIQMFKAWMPFQAVGTVMTPSYTYTPLPITQTRMLEVPKVEVPTPEIAS